MPLTRKRFFAPQTDVAKLVIRQVAQVFHGSFLARFRTIFLSVAGGCQRQEFEN